MTANDDSNENNNDEKQEAPALDLEQVHEQTSHELEDEAKDEDGNSKDTGTDDGVKAGDDDKSDVKEDEDTDADKDTDSDQDSDDEEDLDDLFDDDEDEPEVKEQPALDTDITKEGEGKIALKNADGDIFYFNNLNEVPDDFEPISQVQWAKADRAFRDKEQTELVDRTNQFEQEREREVASLNKSWREDIATLTKTGELPKDKADRKAVVEEVFAFMQAELEAVKDDKDKARRVIDSFADTFERYQYRKDQIAKIEATNKDKKEKSDLKKDKGSRVTASGNKPAGKGKVIEAPPAGLGLDALHESVLGSL